ncbi:MAG: hypothetical protein ABIJ18_02575 [archaeon]
MEEIKEKLRKIKNIVFTKHAEQQLILREGNKEQIQNLIKNPENLIYSETQKNRECLYFNISNKRTIILPVVFKNKTLYILTYIMRYRPWRRKR